MGKFIWSPQSTPYFSLAQVSQTVPVQRSSDILTVNDALIYDHSGTWRHDDAIHARETNGGLEVSVFFSAVAQDAAEMPPAEGANPIPRPGPPENYSLGTEPRDAIVIQFWTDGKDFEQPRVGLSRVSGRFVYQRQAPDEDLAQIIRMTGMDLLDGWDQDLDCFAAESLARLMRTGNIVLTNYCKDLGRELPYRNRVLFQTEDGETNFQEIWSPTQHRDDLHDIPSYALFSAPLLRASDVASGLVYFHDGVSNMQKYCKWLNRRELNFLEKRLRLLRILEDMGDRGVEQLLAWKEEAPEGGFHEAVGRRFTGLKTSEIQRLNQLGSNTIADAWGNLINERNHYIERRAAVVEFEETGILPIAA